MNKCNFLTVQIIYFLGVCHQEGEKLHLDDYLTRLRYYNELPPANTVEWAFWRAINAIDAKKQDGQANDHAKKRMSESFRAVMREIIERAIKRGDKKDMYEALRLFNRSYIEPADEVIRRSRPGRHYVQHKLEWISHSLVQRITRDWKQAMNRIRPLRGKSSSEEYAKLVLNALQNRWCLTESGRASSEPRTRKKSSSEMKLTLRRMRDV